MEAGAAQTGTTNLTDVNAVDSLDGNDFDVFAVDWCIYICMLHLCIEWVKHKQEITVSKLQSWELEEVKDSASQLNQKFT